MPIKSFAGALGLDAFPLRCSEDHDKLLESTTEILRTFYHCVGVPAPAPDKEMYRDIHFIVAGPMGSIQPEQIRLALRSQLMDADGSRIYHFAVLIQSANRFVQVSVESCTSESEYHRIMCFRAYGDLGMILNLLARTHGLSLGCKGLKVVLPSSTTTFIPLTCMLQLLRFRFIQLGSMTHTRCPSFFLRRSTPPWASWGFPKHIGATGSGIKLPYTHG